MFQRGRFVKDYYHSFPRHRRNAVKKRPMVKTVPSGFQNMWETILPHSHHGQGHPTNHPPILKTVPYLPKCWLLIMHGRPEGLDHHRVGQCGVESGEILITEGSWAPHRPLVETSLQEFQKDLNQIYSWHERNIHHQGFLHFLHLN